MHGHMGRWRGIYFPRPSAEEMIHTMDECGVRMLVFCHHAALFCPEIGNAANVEAVRKFPDRLRAYLAVNPHYPDALAADLAAFDEHRDVFVGLKLLASYHQVPWDAPAYKPAWKFAEERQVPEPFQVEELSADEQALLARPIAELNLSVRARKCMIRLGINTFGDLLQRTGDDLLECKNFGVTSLNEVREKLAVRGLKLRGE